MNASSGRRQLVAAFLGGAVLLIAGCSTSNASAGPAIHGTAQPTASALATPSPSATPSTSAALASCKGRALSIVLGQEKVAGGTAHYPIRFLNETTVPCTLYGFPGVSFFGQNSLSLVGPTARSNHGSPEHLITLPPEGFAIAQVNVVNAKNYPPACRQTKVSGILVYPPGITTSLRLPLSSVTCANKRYHVLTVDAVVQGPPPPSGAGT